MQPSPIASRDVPDPDAFALLAETHDDLRRRFDALVAPRWRPPPSRGAVLEAGLWLNIHAAIVTALLYPAVRARSGNSAALAHAEAGLRQLLDALEALLAAGLPEDDLAARLVDLKAMAERQFADEEVALFVQLAREDLELDVDELGRRCCDRRRALIAELGLAEAAH